MPFEGLAELLDGDLVLSAVQLQRLVVVLLLCKDGYPLLQLALVPGLGLLEGLYQPQVFRLLLLHRREPGAGCLLLLASLLQLLCQCVLGQVQVLI